ncbi:MAG: TonB-dependent receptor [Bacteroidales bacterium]|nr:TonB-dependent receptor [Bacteroidales bacterium]
MKIFFRHTALSFLAAVITATSLSAAGDNHQTTDTLATSVITGTRMSVLRDALPAPVSVVGRLAIAASDETAVMPVLMEQVPGLFVTSRGVTGYGVSNGAAGAISLRGFGAAAGRVIILIDGHPQFESIYGHPVADEYMAANAQRVEVSRGAASVLYGSNAMGGAINIITRQPLTDGNHLDFKAMGGSFGTYRASLSDNYKKGRFTSSVTLGHDRTDGHRENSAYHSTNGMVKLGYQLSDAWKAGANVSLMRAYSENPGTVAQPMFDGWSDIVRSMAGISFSNKYDNTSGNIDLYFNYGDHTINDGYTEGGKPREFLFHGTDYTAGLSAYQTVPLFTGNTLTLGTDLIYYGGNAYRDPVNEIYADHKKLNEEAVYVFDQQVFGKFMFNAGIRFDYHSAYGAEWIPQVGISYMPGANTTIKASASKGFRMPNMRELYMYASANAELLPEEAWSYDLTFGHHFLDGALNTELSVFYTKGSNIIEVVRENGKPQNRNVGAFANKGVEFAADWRVSRTFSLNANYSFLHMDTIYTGAPVHKAYAGADWKPGRFSASLGAMCIRDLYLSTGDGAVTSDYVDLKARLGYQVNDWLQVFARGLNLLNQDYATMLGYPEPGITVLGGIAISL